VVVASTVVVAVEPNDDFSSRTILPAGVTTVSDAISGGLPPWPDTTLGAFDPAGGVIDYNDDASPLGDGKASALLEMPVNADGSIHLAVSGFDDFNFNGYRDYWETEGLLHQQTGQFELYVDVYGPGGGLVDQVTRGDALAPGSVFTYDLTGYDPGGTFDAVIDNTVGAPTGSDPMDFMSFTGLTPGTPFLALVVSAGFDPILGLFDDGGNLVDSNDDYEESPLPRIAGIVPASGVVNVAVTGYNDQDFAGEHAASGEYTLVVPEPTGLLLLAAGALVLARRRRR
jgi:hypothetical protein